MKPKLLLTLSSLFLVASLAGCGAEPAKSTLPSSEDSSVPSFEPSVESLDPSEDSFEPSVPSSEPSAPSEEPSDPSEEPSTPSEDSQEPLSPIELFMLNVLDGNMTVVDPDYLTISVYGDDAIYYQYDNPQYGEYGYVLYEGERIFEFTIEEGEVVLTDEIIDEDFEGGTLLTYMANPFILTTLDNEWIEEGETDIATIYSTDDPTVALLTCILGSYGAAAAASVDEVFLTVDADGSQAILSCTIAEQYEVALYIGEFGTTQNDAVDAYLADPWEYVAPEDPGYLDLLLANIDERNFTFTGVADDEVWETVYVMGDEALYIDYDAAEEYGGVDNGLLCYEDNFYKYGIENDVLVDLTFFEALDPQYPSVLDYIYSPFDILDAKWEFVGDNVYETTDAVVLKAMATAVGYGSYSSYFTGVTVAVAEDGSEALFTITNGYDMDLEVLAFDFGDTALKAVTDYFADPYVPSAKTDWSDDTKGIFEEAFGEVIPFYEGFTSKMVETNYLESYGVYFVEDTGLLPDDCFEYGEILLENGYLLDEEESEYDPETGATALLYRKTRGDGKQIIVQVEYDIEAERFQLIIQLYTPPVDYEGLEAINTVILNNGIFPTLPHNVDATFHGTDWALSASDEWITYSIYLDVYITFEDQTALEIYSALFITILEENGFVYDEGYGDWENENFDYVEIGTVDNENSFTLLITFVAYELDY